MPVCEKCKVEMPAYYQDKELGTCKRCLKSIKDARGMLSGNSFGYVSLGAVFILFAYILPASVGPMDPFLLVSGVVFLVGLVTILPIYYALTKARGLTGEHVFGQYILAPQLAFFGIFCFTEINRWMDPTLYYPVDMVFFASIPLLGDLLFMLRYLISFTGPIFLMASAWGVFLLPRPHARITESKPGHFLIEISQVKRFLVGLIFLFLGSMGLFLGTLWHAVDQSWSLSREALTGFMWYCCILFFIGSLYYLLFAERGRIIEIDSQAGTLVFTDKMATNSKITLQRNQVERVTFKQSAQWGTLDIIAKRKEEQMNDPDPSVPEPKGFAKLLKKLKTPPTREVDLGKFYFDQFSQLKEALSAFQHAENDLDAQTPDSQS